MEEVVEEVEDEVVEEDEVGQGLPEVAQPPPRINDDGLTQARC